LTGVRDRDQPGNDAGDPSPSDELPRLDTQQLDVLRQVGCRWARAVGDRESWRQALPVDAGLVRYPSELQPGRFGRFVRLDVQGGRPSQAAAAEEPEADRSGFARLGALAHRLILGPPLKSTAIVQERMRKLIALPVLSSDVLSSVAYGPEAILSSPDDPRLLPRRRLLHRRQREPRRDGGPARRRRADDRLRDDGRGVDRRRAP